MKETNKDYRNKCKKCQKAFESTIIKNGSYLYKPVCPHCGYNNSPTVYYAGK